MIIGGGMGGLSLAQGLKKRGIGCSVYERDASPAIRRQGYRLNINPFGGYGLQECLPESLYSLYLATSAIAYNAKVAKFDSMLAPIGSIDFGKPGEDLSRSHSAVNRYTLRQILLAGLEDRVHYGCRLTGFEQDGNRVKAVFADGSVKEGDVLVAADGIHSAVRSRLFPEAEPPLMQLTSIYGKIPLSPRMLKQVPEALYNAINSVLGPERVTLILAFYQSRMPQQEAAARFAPGVTVDPVEDYLLWGLIAPTESFPDDVLTCEPSALHSIGLGLVHGWAPKIVHLLGESDIPSLFALPMRSSHLIPDWPSSRVTLLGDAIHAMSPAGGSGASTAFLDAALLSQVLDAAEKGEMELIPAIRMYEEKMREYANPIVSHSLNNANQIFFRQPEKGEESRESSRQ
ncbi:FAD-dependent oxidoreductase [Paenibacillus humicola]|uniref:FAD-dependent oxidoreductase n=1 Tax=Paenibacillus humicola TaxID=3110540 RepID=UPI00237A5B13|nr:NAD(P)/FAD-dependent oxidoreductase [Paenibacillus humicola]